ncbi:FGGY-family carbohydrate kinase [Pedobacter sandarakinus]|uniref:FGGY-family carbohydrate kinase n=1 Tax=Pedobacter sandarakinus TaxID=353156 RepID=UPI002247AFD7|nr:FGGY family carbohydrate kinase [Pedobacter sandarakinus]MCX2574682.1 FGGY family carbohydrate kinase [Pedobacter sandarakinus]
MSKPVIAIFDVGKTNKKLFLIDESYQIVYERSARFVETVDEDGEPCENLERLKSSVFEALHQVFQLEEFDIKAINFSTYGASFVYLDEHGEPLTPLYNYLKPYPDHLERAFYAAYGGQEQISLATASPVLGSLNSGMQVYRLKYERPDLFAKVKYALHLPQYLSYLITGRAAADITSIGCHTQLWDFDRNQYHQWVLQEEIDGKFGAFTPADATISAQFDGKLVNVGVGLHDSSAALIPYLANFNKPFILISTGTWCITLNPFNQEILTTEELKQDCLCYMHYRGKPVKASRIFAGYEHEVQLKRIAEHFDRAAYLFKHLKFNPSLILKLAGKVPENSVPQASFCAVSGFADRKLSLFQTAEEAYYQLIFDLVKQQIYALKLVLNSDVKRIFVDGGFGKNALYMQLLANAIPHIEVYASSVSQATAIGTALAINAGWNNNPPPTDMIQLKYYSAIQRSFESF